LRVLVGLLALVGCSSPSAAPAPALPAERALEAGEHEAAEGEGAAGEGDGAADELVGAAGEGHAGDDAVADADAVGAAKADATTSLTEDPWLTELLATNRDIARLMKDPARYRLQVLVTVIAPKRSTARSRSSPGGAEGAPMAARSRSSPGGAEGPRTSTHGYRVDVEYVYPASAIKTFASVAALRKLAALRREGHAVGLDTPVAFCVGEGRSRRCKTKDASNLEGGVITIGHEIRKMQLVSNNFSFNRLYELVGHRELNEDLWALGFSSLRMHHRLYTGTDPLEQRTTPRVELRPAKGKRVVVPARVSDLELPPTEAPELRLGVAYIDDATGSRVDEPMDFADKNSVSVQDLHRLMLALARPDLPGVPELGLDPDDREFLLRAMTEDPLESANPVYTDEHDSGLRYHTMIKGMLRVMALERILYVGKAGKAYGFHLDNAYVEDEKSGRAMAVTVVGYANANGVLNDNAYEYDSVTRPVLLGLGELLGRAVLLGEGLPPSKPPK
jgi:hypothetical protein